jgi:hypothetical protein
MGYGPETPVKATTDTPYAGITQIRFNGYHLSLSEAPLISRIFYS